MAGHRTAVRFPPTVWRGLKLRALDYETSAVALVRQALTDALEGDTAALAASSHQYRDRDTPGQLVTLDLPIVLHRRLRLAVIAHGSTAMAVVLAAIYASWPELVPPPGAGTGRFQRQTTTDTRRLSMSTDTDVYAKAIAAAEAASAAVVSASAASALAEAAALAEPGQPPGIRHRCRGVGEHRPVAVADPFGRRVPVLQAADPVGEHDVQVEVEVGHAAFPCALSARYSVDRPTPSGARRPLRSCRGDDPPVTVVITVGSSEGTVVIDDRWEAVTAAEVAAAGLAAPRRAGSPS